MLNGSNEAFFGIVKDLGVVGYVLDGRCLGAHGSDAAFVGGARTAPAVDPIADGVGFPSVGVAVAMKAGWSVGVVFET